MRDAYLYDAVHTPRGKRKGSLAGVHPVDLFGVPLTALLERNGVPGHRVDDVVVGCVSQSGEQGGCLARSAVLAAGLPTTVPGYTLDRFCGSGLQAMFGAATAIQSGAMDLVIAGGVESMSRLAIGSSWTQLPESMTARYDLCSQYEAAERIAKKWDMSRQECDEFGLRSQQNAARAWEERRFDRELVPVPNCLDHDEHMRPGTTLEKLASLEPLAEGGIITAGHSSGVVDGASAILLGSRESGRELDLTPRARIAGVDVCGSDPELMLTGPIDATRRLLDKVGVPISQVALAEVNEAFATIPMAWLKETGFDPARLNVNGGAIALGHPLGATGALLAGTLLCELERRDERYGLIAICMGYGMGIAALLDRDVD
ncbi:MAG TPA: steroid 3-ketoacyl-CoA thiolase [Deltaproteobacteria bacterium]|nr:acetyl-CoA C-acyltransferase [Deltaproteobacteria bacterium]HCP45692.1 steroid 3-ketoacyl-CoA thiolase [Deltaproteobacteria bacterium]|tara:strand:- start:1330 stop:2451 length:1122 start_codon:yes stop_codon:yes gene_type:complete